MICALLVDQSHHVFARVRVKGCPATIDASRYFGRVCLLVGSFVLSCLILFSSLPTDGSFECALMLVCVGVYNIQPLLTPPTGRPVARSVFAHPCARLIPRPATLTEAGRHPRDADAAATLGHRAQRDVS